MAALGQAQTSFYDQRELSRTSQLRRTGLTAGVGEPIRWKMCRPDVFSIRNTTVASYLEPIVHEIKFSRADLLGDLKCKDKRDSYLDVGGQCW